MPIFLAIKPSNYNDKTDNKPLRNYTTTVENFRYYQDRSTQSVAPETINAPNAGTYHSFIIILFQN
jgi:hypothetical protein